MKTVLAITLFTAIMLTGIAMAQEPVEPLDLRADSVTYFYPTTTTITVAFYFTIYTTEGSSVYRESGVTIKLDGSSVFNGSINFTATSNDCSMDQSCSIPCQVTLQGGDLVWDNCSMWTTWTGVGCDPYDPGHTCTPIQYCACGAQFVVIYTGPYEDQYVLEAEVDGPIYPGISEADETNNVVYMSLAPVGTQPETWSTIKSFYR
jgi:hypothetical protein